MAPNPLLKRKSINTNILIESARALAKPYNDFVEKYISENPDAKGLSYEAISKIEASGKPIVWNGKTIYPKSWKGNLTYISKDTKTEEEHEIDRRAAEVKRWQNKENRKLDEVSEVINHPYNPFGWIPGVRSATNMAISDAAHRTLNPNRYNYDLNAGISLAIDVPMLKWGIGGWKPFVGSYAGTVAGGLVGEQYDSPNLGAFIGGVAGGFSPLLLSRPYNNGTLWDRYTTLGGRFGYWGDNIFDRVIGTILRNYDIGTPKPSMPELIRVEKNGIKFNRDFSNKRFPWINTTTTLPVIAHRNGNWNGSDVIIYNPSLIDNPLRYLSMEPMDTYITGNVIPTKGMATIISGNPKTLVQARNLGYETVSSPKLRKLFLEMKKYDEMPLFKAPRIERTPEALAYMNEILRLLSRRGVPTLSDYKFMSKLTGLPMFEYNYPTNMNLRGRNYASDLKFNTSIANESLFRSIIGMDKHGKYIDKMGPYTDYELQLLARLPKDIFVKGMPEWNNSVVRYLVHNKQHNISKNELIQIANELGVRLDILNKALDTTPINEFVYNLKTKFPINLNINL